MVDLVSLEIGKATICSRYAVIFYTYNRMICIDEEEWSGDAVRKMPDAKVWLLVFMIDIYHTCQLFDCPIVKIAEHVCQR